MKFDRPNRSILHKCTIHHTIVVKIQENCFVSADLRDSPNCMASTGKVYLEKVLHGPSFSVQNNQKGLHNATSWCPPIPHKILIVCLICVPPLRACTSCNKCTCKCILPASQKRCCIHCSNQEPMKLKIRLGFQEKNNIKSTYLICGWCTCMAWGGILISKQRLKIAIDGVRWVCRHSEPGILQPLAMQSAQLRSSMPKCNGTSAEKMLQLSAARSSHRDSDPAISVSKNGEIHKIQNE